MKFPICGLLILLVSASLKNQFCNGNVNEDYRFQYAVGNSVYVQQWEEKSADIVRGSYSFVDANGKVRIVDYQVTGKKGFRSVVKFREIPGYPATAHLKFPHYKHPIILVQPVALMTADLFKSAPSYPNLPQK